MDVDVQKLLKKYPVFEEGSFGKLHCKLTGHDVPPRADTLQHYVNTNKFKTAWEVFEIIEANPNVFEELDEGLLGCKITKTVIARDPKDLRQHLSGKKFKKAVERGVTGDEDEDEAEESGMSEDELSGLEMDEEELKEEQSDDEEEVVNVVASKKTGKGMTSKTSAPVAVDDDSYDFEDAMETETKKAEISKNRKRKNPESAGGGRGKKKTRNA